LPTTLVDLAFEEVLQVGLKIQNTAILNIVFRRIINEIKGIERLMLTFSDLFKKLFEVLQ
jgi:hypothetical protein